MVGRRWLKRSTFDAAKLECEGTHDVPRFQAKPDHKQLGAGIWEARVTFGPGYRIHIGKDGPTIVLLLLLGGSKGSQVKDIKAAKQLWTKYVEDKRDGKAQ